MTNGCGSPCATCGCSPCSCPNPTILNQPRLLSPTVSGGIFTGGTFNGPNINGGTTVGQSIQGATIDCATQGCTQSPGTSDSTLATTAFVEIAINNLISASNPNFCDAVQTCISGAPTLCSQIISCINTTPGSINNFIAFDPSVFASTLQVGVARFASLAELQAATPLLAVEAFGLSAFFAAGGPNPLWTAFEGAVTGIVSGSPTFCTDVFACGVAPLLNPVFTGVPQAATAAPGTNTAQIATTAFVQAAVGAFGAFFAPIDNPTFTGIPAAPTAAPGTNTTQLATTAFVTAAVTPLAPLANPVFSGNPQAPTPLTTDSDDTIATTSFVHAAIDAEARTLFFSSATVGNVGGGADTVAYSHTIAGGTLAVNGDTIEFEATGTTAAGASMRIRIEFGAATVFDSAVIGTAAAETWNLRGTIFRTGANAQKLTGSLTLSDPTQQAVAHYAVGAEALAGNVTLRMLLNGTIANDVVAEAYKDRYVAAP